MKKLILAALLLAAPCLAESTARVFLYSNRPVTYGLYYELASQDPAVVAYRLWISYNLPGDLPGQRRVARVAVDRTDHYEGKTVGYLILSYLDVASNVTVEVESLVSSGLTIPIGM